MGEAISQTVATGIRGAEAEGFIAGTLFSQGWNVTCRALDFQSLLTYCESLDGQRPLLLISTDLEGLTIKGLELLRTMSIKYFLFASTINAHDEFPEAITLPTSALELMGIIRGSLRAPLIRTQQLTQSRARIVGVMGSSHSTGSTTLAINLAAECSELGKKTLLVDAHAFSPSIAIKLGERGLNSSTEKKNLSQNLWAIELTRSDISQQISGLDAARSEYDVIVVDIGVVDEFSESLTGRRWCSEAFIWLTNNGDDLLVLASTDLIGTERLRLLVSDLGRNTIKPRLSFLHALRGPAKRSKGSEDPFLPLVTSLRPTRVSQYPWDTRGVNAAEQERTTLRESNERGLLRRAISDLAGELIS